MKEKKATPPSIMMTETTLSRLLIAYISPYPTVERVVRAK
jgi:hypothetical protein